MCKYINHLTYFAGDHFNFPKGVYISETCVCVCVWGYQQVEDDEGQTPEDGVTRASLCLQGKHHLVLEDDIGLYCKFCSHVELEIKYIVAPFVSLSILHL